MSQRDEILKALRRKLFTLAKDGIFSIRRIDIYEHYAVIFLEDSSSEEDLFELWNILPDDEKFRSGWIETSEGAQKIFIER